MRIRAFQTQEPMPKLRRPHALASLRPWVDVGSVGTLTLARLEQHLEAKELCSLATPGAFFDFTRYRPMVYYIEGQRRMTVPNTVVRYAKGPGDFDLIFLHLLEPHNSAEEYVESVAALLEHFQVQRYCRIGGMYDTVPHTRPLIVSGTLNGKELTGVPGVTSSRQPPYQGPTSIMNLLADRVSDMKAENMSLMVRLPQYIQLEEDYTGSARLLDTLCHLYDFPKELSVSWRGVRQYERISAEMEHNPGVKAMVGQLEADYDARMESLSQETAPPAEEPPPLSPSVEKFLRELGKDLTDS